MSLEDHFLVQLADAAGRVRIAAGQEHAVQTAVRNRPRVDDRQTLRAFARAILPCRCDPTSRVVADSENSSDG